jgi:hypothetical protein
MSDVAVAVAECSPLSRVAVEGVACHGLVMEREKWIRQRGQGDEGGCIHRDECSDRWEWCIYINIHMTLEKGS